MDWDRVLTVSVLSVILLTSTLGVIRVEASTLVSSIPVGDRPEGLDFDPTRNKIWATNRAPIIPSSTPSISVIDATTNTELLKIPVGADPKDVVAFPAKGKVYVANQDSANVSVIDADANVVLYNLTHTSGFGAPTGLAIDQDRDRLLVANRGTIAGARVHVFDANTDTIIDVNPGTPAVDSIVTGPRPIAIAYNPVTAKYYVANEGTTDGSVTVVDANTFAVLTTINFPGGGQFLGDIAVDDVTNMVYVTNYLSTPGNPVNQLYVVNGTTDTYVTAISMAAEPGEIFIDKSAHQVYVSERNNDSVGVVNESTNTLYARCNAGDEPRGLLLDPSALLYVASRNADHVMVIDDCIHFTDLQIIKTDAPDPVLSGSTLSYTLTVNNLGPVSADKVIVTDTLPAGVTFNSATGAGWNCLHSSGTVTCSALSALFGSPPIIVSVDAPTIGLSAETLLNTASVSSGAVDTNVTNNLATAQTLVNPSTPPGGSGIYCNGMTIPDLIASGLYNVIDNTSGAYGIKVKGTNGPDLILLSNLGNHAQGKDGNDCIIGGAARDVISGGLGDDIIFGGAGNDHLTGRIGADSMFGEGDNDIVSGGPGNDSMDGGIGNDIVFGRDDDDAMTGGDGNDYCSGGAGADTADANCEISAP